MPSPHPRQARNRHPASSASIASGTVYIARPVALPPQALDGLLEQSPANDVVLYDPATLAAKRRLRIDALKESLAARAGGDGGDGHIDAAARLKTVRELAFKLRRAAFGAGAVDVEPLVEYHR